MFCPVVIVKTLMENTQQLRKYENMLWMDILRFGHILFQGTEIADDCAEYS